ncbi:hypothetical protein ACODM8_14520 [Vibrio ostreicida]|uniref:Uncharacterized protein n=1 Tax=Vibrio ostreicida TaxID=526588 RepID=A0ABT8BSG7_9VIBR|nr:hypothetical protein [Vibrio ostreicida]MDN3610050.1 hypothetical protein [Vibrio ostreicida]NPD10078.1 hypothetical protein [Vibrio ostreicida]
MKLKQLISCIALCVTSSAFANTSTYVYCGLPDGSDWDWLLDHNDNYTTIEGQWGRVTQPSGRYFNVFRVTEAVFEAKAFSCPAGYIAQPADSGTSRWEIFEIIRPDGSRYFIDAYRTYYHNGTSRVEDNFQLRV